jgi:asparagine synthase (glutamine-hydrolysing)
MCGIAGLLLNGKDAGVDPERLDAMVDALAHRGPDDRGTRIDGRVGIGMRRLSIIDTEGGHQPLSNEDGTVWIVYNGECYNFQAMRSELKAEGHRFRTRSDTEVVVHGYEQWGARGLAARLNGIYAFCVWDARRRVATIVRDRLGVKPLYYTARASGLAFASELRALARSGFCLPKIDEEALWSYLLYQFVPTERTLLAGARRLPAGHLLEWFADTGTVVVERYWDLPDGGERTDLAFDDAAAELVHLLDDTVAGQMVADVPIGCFLSGGLDSSIVAALMARHADAPIRTYSIGFPNAGWHDETRYAEAVAQAIGARHTTVPFDDAAFLHHIDDYLARVDEPVADAAMLPTYALSRVAAQDVKVVLTGEGADEVFAGYDYYRKFVDAPPPLKAAERGARAAWLVDVQRELGQRIGGAFPAPVRDLESASSGFPYAVQPEFIWCMLEPDRRPPLAEFLRSLKTIETSLLPWVTAHTPLQRALYTDTKLWLAQDLMNKLDKSTMAHGLEGRVPLLDHRIVEFAFDLPDRFKIGASGGKRILREAARGLLSREIVERDKHGFGVPIDTWFRTSLAKYVRDVLMDSALIDEGIFTRQAMEAVLCAHIELGVDMGRTLWSLVTLDRWWRGIRDEVVAALPKRGPIATIGSQRDPTVEILVPIHESFNLVRDCVRSIRAFTQRPFRAILLDDASSAETQARLRELIAGDRRFELVCNEENLGFVGNCIRGFARCTADYVVLLNSDTAVAPGWLERMVACAQSDPRIAIVNPVTNESGNTSVRLAPGLNLLTMAQRIGEISRRRYPDITTGVGMCMLVRRTALELLGGFDRVFAPAYCEESDLCMRFTEAGLRVVAADDAFIYHKGWASYDEAAKDAHYTRNRALFDARWSAAYERDWAAYARRDPLQYLRDALLWETLTPAEADSSTAPVIEAGLRQLDTCRALAAADDGVRASVALALLPQRAAARERETLRDWGAMRKARPLATFDARALSFPTRGYVENLPQPAPGKLSITFLVADLSLSGGVISIVQLAREMLLAGHDVKVVTEAHEIVPELYNLWAQPLVYRDRAHLLAAFPESDIVVATFWVTAHRYMRELRKRHSFVSVYFIQDYEAWFYPPDDVENRRNASASYALTEHRIVKSRWLADMVEQHGPVCDIVPLGLDLGVFYRRSAPRGVRPRVISVAAPQAEVRRRGFSETVAAFQRVHDARPDVELVFFGADANAMPKLPFPYTNAGRLRDQNKVATLLSSADVLVDASLWQGFGRPGLEAMACGVAPVLSNVGGLREYARDGENCLLVPPGDAPATADAILRLLDETELRTRLSAAGPATARAFSHEIEAQRHLALYTRWIETARKATGMPSPR